MKTVRNRARLTSVSPALFRLGAWLKNLLNQPIGLGRWLPEVLCGLFVTCRSLILLAARRCAGSDFSKAARAGVASYVDISKRSAAETGSAADCLEAAETAAARAGAGGGGGAGPDQAYI